MMTHMFDKWSLAPNGILPWDPIHERAAAGVGRVGKYFIRTWHKTRVKDKTNGRICDIKCPDPPTGDQDALIK